MNKSEYTSLESGNLNRGLLLTVKSLEHHYALMTFPTRDMAGGCSPLKNESQEHVHDVCNWCEHQIPIRSSKRSVEIVINRQISCCRSMTFILQETNAILQKTSAILKSTNFYQFSHECRVWRVSFLARGHAGITYMSHVMGERTRTLCALHAWRAKPLKRTCRTGLRGTCQTSCPIG